MQFYQCKELIGLPYKITFFLSNFKASNWNGVEYYKYLVFLLWYAENSPKYQVRTFQEFLIYFSL